MPSCDDCNKSKNVSWAYVECLTDSHKSTVWKLWVTILLLIVALVVSNVLWLKAWNEYDYTTTEIEQDGRGINIYGDHNDTEQINGTEDYYTTENP